MLLCWKKRKKEGQNCRSHKACSRAWRNNECSYLEKKKVKKTLQIDSMASDKSSTEFCHWRKKKSSQKDNNTSET